MLAKSCRYRSTTRITARRVSSDTSRPLRRFTPPQCRIQYRQYSLFVPFPGVQVSKAALNLDSELPQVHDCIDTNDYLVVVFGWLRAEQRPLHKYVQLHNSRGFDVASYVPPALLVAYPNLIDKFSARVSQEIIDCMLNLDKDSSYPSRKLIFHIFSNNGYFNFCFLLDYLLNTKNKQHASLYDNISACIVDSAPSKLDVSVLTRGFVGALYAHRHLPNAYHPTITPMLNTLWGSVLRIPKINKQLQKANQLLETAYIHKNWPYLYLYSSADEMVFADDIIHHIHQMESHGVEVYSHNFETSAHVEHYRYFPEQYSAVVDQFLKKVDERKHVPERTY